MDDDFKDHPDWGRYLVPPASKVQPVGDPTRWGASALTLLQTPTATAAFPSTQIIQSATRDGYSRSWGLNGTLSLPTPLWQPVLVSGCLLIVVLQVQMGVGQVQVLHEITLFHSGIVPPAGLCMSQYDLNGGVYEPYLTPTLSSVAGTTDLTFAFAAIGALIGSTINIRVKYTTGAAPVPPAVFPCQSQVNLVLTPFAAGEGL